MDVVAVLRVAGEYAGVAVAVPGSAARRMSSTRSSFSESSSARAGGALDGRPEPRTGNAREEIGVDRLQLLR